MNIVLLHYTAPPVVGGVETVMARQARQLAQAGHQVSILAGRGQTWDARIPVECLSLIDPRNPQVLRVKSSLDAGKLPPGFEDLVAQVESELRRALRDAPVVIAHNVASLNKNLALTAALYRLSQENSRLRLILWHHDLAWNTGRYLPELHDGYPWDLLRTAWPGVKQVTVSEARRQELAALMDLPLRQILQVPSALDLADFLGLPHNLAVLAGQSGLTLAGPVLISPVRITRRKNLELALKALAELRQRMPRAMWVVTGQLGGQGAAYLAELKALRQQLGLEDAAHFLVDRLPDGLSEADLAAFYRLADALLITSQEEGFGMPLLEAGLAGLPIFCTRLDALQALAGENATYFSPDENPRTVAALIAGRLQGDQVYRMRMRVRRDYTWEAIYQRQLAPLLEG